MLRTFTWAFLIPSQLLISDPLDKFPSCLKKGITWDQSNVIDLIVNIPTPEECQVICGAREDCQGFTWLEESSAIYPLSCGLFSDKSIEEECPHCVSGYPTCPCHLHGECISHEDNMIEVRLID